MLEYVPDESMPQPLKALEPRHKAACRLRLQGKDNDFIAKELNVRKPTLYFWFSDPLVKEYLDDLAQNIEVEFAVEMARAGMVAIQELTGEVQKPSDQTTITTSQRVNVAREILDRLPSTARIADRPQVGGGGGDGDTNYTAIFANMDDQDLVAFINRWKAGDANGANGDAARTIEGTAKPKS